MHKEEIIFELTKILNEMPVGGSVGYRTEIGDKFRKAMDDLFQDVHELNSSGGKNGK